MSHITNADKRRAEELYPHKPYKKEAYLEACSEKNEEMEREAIGFKNWWESKIFRMRKDILMKTKTGSDHELYTLYKQQKQ